MTPKPKPPAEGVAYVSDKQLARRYGINRATVWRWAATGRLPAPVRLTPNVTRWDLRAVEAFDAARDGA